MNNLRSKSAVSSEQLAVSSRQSAGKSRLFFLPTAICQFLTISIFLLTANCLLPTSANAIGTTANTQILNTPTAVTLNFSNATGTGTVTRNSYNSVTSSVTAVYGISGTFLGGQITQNTEAGVEVAFSPHNITNLSNTPVNINANSGEVVLVGPAPGDFANWRSRFGSQIGELDELTNLTSLTPLPSNLFGHTAGVYNGRLYIFSGTDSITNKTDVYVSTINANGTLSAPWVSTTSLPRDLKFHSTSFYKNRVYVIGGQYGSSVTFSNEVYMATINSDGSLSGWTLIDTGLPTLSYHSSSIYNGRIYVVGGYKSTGTYENAVHYATINADGSLSAWTTAAVPVSGLVGHTTSIYNGRIYVLGGGNFFSGSTGVYYASIASDGSLSSWSSSTSLQQPLIFHTANIHNGRIYVIGGYNGSTDVSTIYSANINSDGTVSAWATLGATLIQATRWHTASIYDGRVYITGGTDGSNYYNSVYSTNLLDKQDTNVANDAIQNFNFYMIPANDAIKDSQGLVTLNYFLSKNIPSTQIGAYSGFNGKSYGGSGRLSPLTTTTVIAPDVVLLSRSVTAIAPTGLGYVGSATDTVPGSQLLYTIVIKNTGNANSSTVNVIEKINNTNDVAYYYASGTTANFTISGFSTNTTVNYSTNAGGSFPLVNTDLSGKYDTAINAIRWTLDSIPLNKIATLNYRVVIKQN